MMIALMMKIRMTLLLQDTFQDPFQSASTFHEDMNQVGKAYEFLRFWRL